MRDFATIFIVALLSAMTLAGCSRERAVGQSGAYNAIRFSAIIEDERVENASKTRVLGTEWEAGDAIGIFMLPSGGDMEQSYGANVRHVNSSDGDFRVSDVRDALFYPADGSSVDFVAYYPYTEVLDGDEYLIDVRDQSDSGAIDFLYSDNERGKSEGSPYLCFDHVLSRIVFDVAAKDSETDLRGLQVFLSGVGTRGRFDLGDGVLSVDPIEGEVLGASVESTAGWANVSAIVLPGQTELRVHFVFGDGDESVLELKGVSYDSGVSYSYDIEVDESAQTVVVEGGQIGEWDDQAVGGYDIGKGERERFYLETLGDGSYVYNFQWVSVDEFTDWSGGFTDVDYSALSGSITVRSDASAMNDPHLFFGTGDGTLTISELPTEGWANVEFSCVVDIPQGAASDEILIFAGGREMDIQNVSGNGSFCVEFDLPAGVNDVRIEGVEGMEVDDVCLTGLRINGIEE